MGYESLRSLAITMFFTRFGHVDDAWLGLVMAKLGYEFSYIPDSYLWPADTTKISTVSFASFWAITVRNATH